MAHHIATSSDTLVQLCYELDRLLPALSSVFTRANNYCDALSIEADLQSCDFAPLKSTICKLQYDQLLSSLTTKPLHVRFYSLLNDGLIDKHRSLC